MAVVKSTNVEAAALKLLGYCVTNRWAGHDPYDALNSPLFTALPFLNARLPRLLLTQLLKRSPVDLRPLLRVPKTQNPKAIALFLSALLKLSRTSAAQSESSVEYMLERLIALRSAGIPYYCWGYSFPWQTRTIIVPTGTPNLVCTAFVANALLDAYEQRRDPLCLSMAVSAAQYIRDELYWTDGRLTAGFSYPLPLSRSQVHNANFLGSALLCRVHKHTNDKKFLGPALRVARHSAVKQHADGSWYYGEAPSQRWIDNFHTGYNLCALHSIGLDTQTREFEPRVRRGLAFYKKCFFRQDGAPRYFHNRTYPVDIHCVAQSIITLLSLKDLDASNVFLARSVLQWAMDHMWDARGFFYYRVFPFCTIRTSYIRWAQAWMLLALSTVLCDADAPTRSAQDSETTARLRLPDASGIAANC